MHFILILIFLLYLCQDLITTSKVDPHHYKSVYVNNFRRTGHASHGHKVHGHKVHGSHAVRRGSPYPYYEGQLKQHERDLLLYQEVAREHQDQRKDYEKQYQESQFERNEINRVKCEAAREATAAPPDVTKDADKAKTKRHRLRLHKISKLSASIISG